jgi:dUTP pyrophosphatase
MSKPLVSFKRIHPQAKMPEYATPEASGADLFAVEDVIIPGNAAVLVKTGLQVELAPGWEIQVRSKSGLALKDGLHVLNSPGTVDSDYRGEIGVVLANINQSPRSLKAGQKVAQIVVSPVTQAQFKMVEDLSTTTRGEGGFGSTGL